MQDEDKMISEKISLMIENISDAELVLIGIGEEYELGNMELSKDNNEAQTILKLYMELAELIKDKNYFIISLCTDGYIRKCGLKNERIVEPCGNYNYMQCSEKCTNDLYEAGSEYKMCPKCNKPLVHNRIEEAGANYVEEGYLEQWKLYKKWLQGTVNRKVCILEIGVGMRYPSVIRFPFEKIVYFNQKASFYRIHSRLYQITEEIKEKSYGIPAKALELLNELSKRI